VTVVFITKHGKATHGGPKYYRTNSLTSFLLKSMERLVDRFRRDEMAVSSPLHPNLHAYQTGKFTETALHQLLVRVEVLDQKETALGIFLDTDGAFNNTSYDSNSAASVRHAIRATLESRRATANLGGLQEFSGGQGLSTGRRIVSPILVPANRA
jgi:hypothetical protein